MTSKAFTGFQYESGFSDTGRTGNEHHFFAAPADTVVCCRQGIEFFLPANQFAGYLKFVGYVLPGQRKWMYPSGVLQALEALHQIRFNTAGALVAVLWIFG